jgi:hypothetical protein
MHHTNVTFIGQYGESDNGNNPCKKREEKSIAWCGGK